MSNLHITLKQADSCGVLKELKMKSSKFYLNRKSQRFKFWDEFEIYYVQTNIFYPFLTRRVWNFTL